MKNICKRCSTSYDEDNKTRVYFGDFEVDRIRIGNSETHLSVMNLCPKCAASFVDWFSNFNKEENVNV